MRAIYERMILSSVDGIFAFDRDFRFTVWNPAAERIFGRARCDVLGTRVVEHFPELRAPPSSPHSMAARSS